MTSSSPPFIGINWDYHISQDQIYFAHRLIDGGVDVVHGHSSHHPRPIEVYRDKLVLYGCGDFLNDYEGIKGYEEFRDDLRLLYFVSVQPQTGKLASLRMVPMQARQMRLRHASRKLGHALDHTQNALRSRPSADDFRRSSPVAP